MTKRKFTRREFLTVSSATAAGAILVACAPAAPVAPISAPVPTETDAGTSASDTLVFATASPWGTFSPFRPTYQYGYSSNFIAMLTHSRLIDLDRFNQIHPSLATSWEVSDDATVYTFTLRNDVLWHDGTPFTAKDVEATLRFILTKETNINPSRWLPNLKGAQAFYDGESDEIPGIQVADDYTITFELNGPKVGWHTSAITDLQILPAHIFATVNPADIVEHHAPAWYTPELNIGTGPFKFVQAERDQFVELVRNESYFGGVPQISRLLFKNLGTADTQFIALQKGELDIWNVPLDYYDEVQRLDNVNIHLVDRNYIRVFLLHYESPKLADKRVRQAIAYGINRTAISESFYSGLTKPYNSYMETVTWLAPGLNDYSYNPELARELLAQAQADGTWDPNNELKLIWYYSDALHQDLMAAIQQDLAQIGIKVQLQYMEGTSAVAAQSACEFDMYYQGWGFAFPEEYQSFFTDAERCTTPWDDPEAAEWFKLANVTFDENERRAIHNKIQAKLNEELPMLPFLQFTGVAAVNKRVAGFDENALWCIFYQWNHGFNNAVNWSLTA